jgi:eukaryotic-like serine/threonine-protein kinase
MMDFAPGQTIGDYEILRILGAGGMGKVYQVRNNISHRVEAMKVLLPDLTSNSDLVDRFVREIRISASLDHPNIAALRTAQRVDNQLLMVMEYVEGSTFDTLMRAGRIPVERAVDYTSQALSALAYAHSRGVTHRDIKPGNIMLTPAGIVKVMDFGIARLASDAKLTKTGVMVGSVYYMSPEQIEGRDPDARSDLYSLGITLYEIATGKRPFSGDSEYQIMAAHLKTAPPPPREIDPSLPAELNDVILKSLAKDPGQRFQTADEFRAALSSLLPQPAQTKTAPGWQPPIESVPPIGGRRLLYMVAGSLATIAALVFVAVEIPQYRQAHANPQAPKVSAPTPLAAAPIAAAPTPAPQENTLSQPVDHATPIESVTPPQLPPATDSHLTKSGAVAPSRTASQRTASQRTPTRPAGSQAPAQFQEPSQVKPSPANLATPTPAQTSAAPAESAELTDLSERMMKMAARIGAITASIESLQRAQAQQGVGLRSDMVAAQQRLNYQMNEAESNLKQRNAVGAKKRLDGAEQDLEKLENFLGK